MTWQKKKKRNKALPSLFTHPWSGSPWESSLHKVRVFVRFVQYHNLAPWGCSIKIHRINIWRIIVYVNVHSKCPSMCRTLQFKPSLSRSLERKISTGTIGHGIRSSTNWFWPTQKPRMGWARSEDTEQGNHSISQHPWHKTQGLEWDEEPQG